MASTGETLKCTFDDCERKFSSVEAMRKHKAKDKKIHPYYCKKCDSDCADDILLFIHQIESSKHMACPVCGAEFKSQSGRDRHVGIDHVTKSNIGCPGCKLRFNSAADLMGHIEDNKCSQISRNQFLQTRAQQEAVREFQASDEGPLYGMPKPNPICTESGSSDQSGGVSLLDDIRVPRSQFPVLRAESNFPALTDMRDTLPFARELLDIEKPAMTLTTKHRSTNLLLNDDDMDGRIPSYSSALSRDTHQTKATQGTTTIDDWRPSGQVDNENDPNFVNRQVQVKPDPFRVLRDKFRSDAQRFFNPLTATYVCPAPRCGQVSASLPAFENHFIDSGVHMTSVQCPECLKKFKSTTAWVAHAESGSVKCRIRDRLDIDLMMKIMTGGMIRVDERGQEDGSMKLESMPVGFW